MKMVDQATGKELEEQPGETVDLLRPDPVR
jgi:hypothetical protein